MNETPSAQQFPARRRLGFFFIFRIAPGFFVGFIPRQFAFSSGYDYDDQMVIQQINEQEYMFLRRMGTPEISVMMEHGFGEY